MSSKAYCCSVPHSNRYEFLKTLKNSNPLLADLVMNLFNAASLPINFCTYFLFVGGCILIIAEILWGFASIPLAETNHPNSFPFRMPKMHLSRFRFRPLFHRFVKVSWRSSVCVSFLSLLTAMLLTYVTKFLPFCL
jgi:hypothetical protein